MADTAEFIVRLRDKVSGPARKAEGSVAKLRFAMGKLNPGAEKTGGSLGSLAAKIGGVYAAVRLASGAVGGISKIFQAGLGAEQGIYALDRLGKHFGMTGRKMFNEINALAADFGLNVEDTQHQFANLLKLQFSPESAKDLIKMGADMQALGADAEDVSGILRALGQIKSKGRLQAEEMLQLAERGVSQQLVWEEAGKLMGGKTTDEIRKLQEQGKVTGDIALKAIENAINRKLNQSQLGESGLAFAKTMPGMVKVAKTNAELTAQAWGEQFTMGIERSGAMGKLQDIFGSTEFKAFGLEASNAFNEIGKVLGEFLPVAVEGMIAFGRAFMEGFGEVWGSFSDMNGGAKGIAQTFREDFIPAMVTAGTVLGKIIAAVVTTGIVLADLASKTVTIGKNIVEGLWNGITGQWGAMLENFKALANMLPESLKRILGIASPSKEFAYLGEMSALGFQEGLDSMQPNFDGYSPSSAQVSRGAGAAGRGAGGVSIGAITIEVTGSGDAEETGRAVLRVFEERFSDLMNSYVGEVYA